MSFAVPVHVSAAGKATPMRRVALQQGGSNQFKEDWLQNFLFTHPETIPFRDFDPALGTVLPVCREMSTPAGFVDLVCVTTAGKIVLIETKLFRNPEARRQVVSQILDYAKEMTSWRFEQLAAQVASATGKRSSHLLDLLRLAVPQFDEARFVDSINRSLARADMTLLIVGDGIQRGAEALVGFLERHGGLQFSFGLLEVAVFETEDGSKFIQSRILTKTELLRRTLLVGPSGESIQEATPESGSEADVEPTWQQVFWTEYFALLRLDDISQPIPPKPPRGTNAYFPMPPSGGVNWVSAYLMSSKHRVGVYLVLSNSYAPNKDVFAALAAQRADIEREIGLELSWESSSRSFSVTARKSYADIDSVTERSALLGFLADMTNKFVNAFRPSIEAALRGLKSAGAAA